MSTKDFFSEPVPEDQDFNGEEGFGDMQSLDLFEDSTDADPAEGFAAFSDLEAAAFFIRPVARDFRFGQISG